MENKWISVDVKLPDSDKPVLIRYEYFRHGKYNRMYQTYGIGYCMKQSTGERWWYIDQGGYKAKVLYWRLLPPPVKIEEEPPEENEESEDDEE